MQLLAPAWPPNARASNTPTESPSDQFELVRVFQDRSVWADRQRQFVVRAGIVLEQRLRIAILGRIEHLVRVGVAGKKVLQPDHVGMVRRADQARTAGPGFDQEYATQDQRTHDPLAKMDFGDQQGAQPGRRDEQCLAVGERARVDQRRTA
jgi:hypothetical protein